ncbi:UV-damage endonuclease like protein [Verticillium longisporum]|nr:UV-damage endonuclease like protein [Verticillium longisporum]
MEATNSAAAPPLPSLEQDTPARRRDAARQVATPRKCVSDVMKELSDMEERLQSSVKRQRLAIQDSGLVDDVPPRRPLKPQAARKSRNVVRENLANGVRMATSVDAIEHAPSLDTDAIAAANDIEADADDREQEAEEEPAERGAARPPPVNSNLLPLPWKGRIGYACLNTYLREAIPPVFSSPRTSH